MRTMAWIMALTMMAAAPVMARTQADAVPTKTPEAPSEKKPPTCAGSWSEVAPAFGPWRPLTQKDAPGVRSLFLLRRGSWFLQGDWNGQVRLERDERGDRWQLNRYVGQQAYSGRDAPQFDDGCPADGDWRTAVDTWTFAVGECAAADKLRGALAQAVHGFATRFSDTLNGKSVESPALFAGSNGLGVRYELETSLGPSIGFFETQGEDLTVQSENLLKALRACAKSVPATPETLPSSSPRPKPPA